MSVYQLNDGKVFWDPYKHRRNQGEQPYYRWQGYRGIVNSDYPSVPAVHVQRPITHGEKFDKRWYPSSELSTRGPRDEVMYHPKYEGSKVKDSLNGQILEPIDDQSIFRPPEGENNAKWGGLAKEF